MLLHLSYGDQKRDLELPCGELKLGGDPADDVHIDGVGPSVLLARVSEDRVKVTGRVPVSINGITLLPGMARLLMPGDRVALSEGALLEVPAAQDEAEGTHAVLRDLLATDEAGPGAAPTLTCLTGLDCGKVYSLERGSQVVGRGLEAQLRIRDRAVSRKHARLSVMANAVRISDLGSPNGLVVNGVRTTKAVYLKTQDIVELGDSLLRFDWPHQPKVEEKPEPATPLEPTTRERPARSLARWKQLRWVLLGMGASIAAAGAAMTLGFAL